MIPIETLDFKSLFETAPGLYLVLKPDLTIVAASNAYLEATLTEREGILGRYLFDVFPDNPQDKEANGVSNLGASLNYVLQYGKPHEMAIQKYDIRRPDGQFEVRYWSPLNKPVFNAQHELVYIIHNVVDVTGHQQTKSKLKKSEGDYQLLVDSVKDYAIFMIDTDGCVASWNSGAAGIKGYVAKEIIGSSIDIFYTREDRKKGVPQKNLQMALQKGHYETEGWRVRKDGSLFWANIVITALRDEKSELYGYSKITRDITERKKMQDQLQFLSWQIDQSLSAILTIDVNHTITSWNIGAEKLYGYSKEEAQGRDAYDILWSAYSREQVDNAFLMLNKLGYWSGEMQRKTKSNTDIFLRTAVTVIRDNMNVITGYVGVSFDISEQVRLRLQINHLANIVEQSSEAIISRGVDLRMMSWNRGAEELFGYTKEEAIGKTAIELGIVNMTGQALQEARQEIFEKGTWKSEMDFFNKDGSSFYGAVVGNAVKNEFGDTDSIVFIIKDISLHKQLESQLIKHNQKLEEKVRVRTEEVIKAEKRFRALIENSNDIITLVDNSLKVIYRSPSNSRITGWTNEDMVDSPGTKNVHPDDKDKVKDMAGELLSNPGKPVYGKLRNQHKDGHYLWLEGVAINLLHDQDIHAIVFNFRDVTKRIEAEEKLQASENLFRALIENSHDIITLMDSSFNILYRSPAAARVLGWTNTDMLGADATMNIHTDEKTYAADVVKEVIGSPGKAIHTKFRMYHKEGHYLWLEGTLTNLLHDKYVKAIVFNFRNVTERVEAEEKLKEREKQLELFIEYSPASLAIFDTEMRYLAVSRRWATTYKLDPKALIGKIHYDVFPNLPKYWKDVHRRCLAGGVERNENDFYIQPDGTPSWLRWEVHPWNKASGEIGGIIIFAEDITDKMLAEQQKEFDNNNLKALISNTHDLMWSVDTDYKLITSNEAFDRVVKSLAGRTIAKGGNTLIKELTDTKLLNYKAFYDRALKGESFTEVVHDDITDDFWSEISFYPIYDKQLIVGTACFSRNITEKKKAEEEIRKSNERFELVVTATNDVIWDWDILTDTLWRNKNYYSHFGYDRNGAPAHTNEWHNSIHPDDRQRVLSGIRTGIENLQDFWKDEYRFLKADGTVAFVLDCGYILYTGNGTPYRMVGAMLDITGRKIAEQELQKSYAEKQALAEKMSIILNTLPANIALLDDKGFIVEVNDAWRHFADDNGFTGSNYCLGNNYINISKNAFGKEQKDGKQVARGIQAVLKHEIKEFVFEYECTSSSVERWFRMVVTPLQHREYGGAVVMHIDISELRRLEQERLKAKTDEQRKITQAMLQGQEKERNAIGKELHDNVNQILVGTKLFLSMVKNDPVKHADMVSSCMDTIQSAIDENRKIAHELVAPALETESFFDLLVNLTDKMLKISGVEVVIDMTGFREGLLDEQRMLAIYRIVQEQCTNIVKYAKAHKVKFNLNTSDHLFNMTIADDGVGMENGKLTAGIGLKNIRGRLTLFNGTVTINAAPGKGFTMGIKIPYD